MAARNSRGERVERKPFAVRIRERAMEHWNRQHHRKAVRYLLGAAAPMQAQAWAKLCEQLPADFAQLLKHEERRAYPRADEDTLRKQAAERAREAARIFAFWTEWQVFTSAHPLETRQEISAAIPGIIDLVMRHSEDGIPDPDLLHDVQSELSCPLVVDYDPNDIDTNDFQGPFSFDARGYESASMVA